MGVKRSECSGFARVNKVTSASLGYPLSVFNTNSTLKTPGSISARDCLFVCLFVCWYQNQKMLLLRSRPFSHFLSLGYTFWHF